MELARHRGVPAGTPVYWAAGLNFGKFAAPRRFRPSRDAVASEHPDLVLWQLGTNAVLRGYEHAKSDSVIREGIRRIKATGAERC
jgi:hypothetical protein